jgi:hypothetical protein
VAVDYGVPEGQVRLLIADTNEADLIYQDAELSGFLALNGDDVRLAAADALDAMASSEAMVSKVIRTQDLSTDGAKVADALRVHATQLREQAGTGADLFDIVDTNPPRWPVTVWGL